MKTLNIILCSLFLSTLLLTSCDKSITVKGENGKEYTTYQAACRDNDYNAAHEFVELLKQKNVENDWQINDASRQENKKAYEDAVIYVYTQEIMYLISEGSETSNNRILYLITEIPSQMPEHAGILDDREKAEQKQKLSNMWSQIIKLAYSQNNFDLVKKILDSLDSSEEKVTEAFNLLSQNKGNKAELANYIVENLRDYDFEGQPVTEGFHDADYLLYIPSDNLMSEEGLYAHNLSVYNSICNKIFNYAISKGDEQTASSVLGLFKKSIVYKEGEGVLYHNGKKIKIKEHQSYLYLTNKDKESAQKRFKEAVANGSFKKAE